MEIIITGHAGIASASMPELSWLGMSSSVAARPRPAAAAPLRLISRPLPEVDRYAVRTSGPGDAANRAIVAVVDGASALAVDAMTAADHKFSTLLGPSSASPPV